MAQKLLYLSNGFPVEKDIDGDYLKTVDITAKGDLLVGTGAATYGALTVGSNDYVLTADDSTPTGLKWATAGSSSSTILHPFLFMGY